MTNSLSSNLSTAIHKAGVVLSNTGLRIESNEWQGQKSPDDMLECLFHSFRAPIPNLVEDLKEEVKPNLPWAEEHFQERVSGEPLNPPPSHIRWPFAKRGNEEHTKDEKFSHTYPERFWPKLAGAALQEENFNPNKGIRYDYGDLYDVVRLLGDKRLTRQAYLPIFFPEDTGATEGQRVPCSLGYQFLWRAGHLHCIYNIRSCDYFRHFRDDVYMAARLTQWVGHQLHDQDMGAYSCKPGFLQMNIGSLHVFWQEKNLLKRRLNLG